MIRIKTPSFFVILISKIHIICFFSAPGESTEIAEEMAARDALKRIFRFDETSSKPLPLGRDAKQMKEKDFNLTIEEWKSKNVTTV